MTPNAPIIDPSGRPAKLITLPIPGRVPALAVVLYEDGRAKLVDLKLCKTPVKEAVSWTD
jgi:hypothetical protein